MLLNIAHLFSQRLARHQLALLQSAAESAAKLGYSLYLVGGTVRDMLLGLPTRDLDLTVVGDGLSLATALAHAVNGKVTARSQFGTARVRAGELSVDIATARGEQYSRPGALPVVTPGSLEEDLLRRDFTIHAMAVDLMPPRWGGLVDFCGGQQDLEARRIRILHQRSFQDDPTRMVRALRYAARLSFQLEARTEARLRRDVSYLRLVSGPRRWRELQRLVEEEEPETALVLAQGHGLLSQLHPALHADPALTVLFQAARRDAQPAKVSPVVSLCLLAWRMSQPQRSEVAADLRLPGVPARALLDLTRVQELLPRLASPEVKPSQITRWLKGIAIPALTASSIAAEPPAVRQKVGDYLAHWRYVKPRLGGEALGKLGVPVGPRMGELLEALRAARLDGEVSSKEEEITLVQDWLAEKPKAGQ